MQSNIRPPGRFSRLLQVEMLDEIQHTFGTTIWERERDSDWCMTDPVALSECQIVHLDRRLPVHGPINWVPHSIINETENNISTWMMLLTKNQSEIKYVPMYKEGITTPIPIERMNRGVWHSTQQSNMILLIIGTYFESMDHIEHSNYLCIGSSD
ncbi:hypothetical protein B0A48_15603 [Cryoendolithus antarcticus]|uniref:Uncharacterized protein n=1 Tax=Cryoendolithus antarcticus TaxID=1507870 RepID=A0A1V8SGP6_9PEZI|nr:hypothetical protein B0A48_15603 [Cryoendolithus antarcticus]